MTTQTVAPRSGPAITSDEAMRIARLDAEPVYGDLTGYSITVCYGQDGWHVDYELTEPLVAGGGPHYVIDGTTGRILSKRYDQ